MRIRRIQSSLIQSFAVLIVFTIVLLGAVSIYFFKKTIVGIAEQNTMQLVSQLNRVIDTYIAYMDDIALVLVNNADVRAYIDSPRASPPPLRLRIEQFLGSVTTVRKDIDGIFLLPQARSGVAAPAGPASGGTESGGTESGGPDVRSSLILAAAPGGVINPDFDFRERYGAYADELESGKAIVTSAHVENVLDDRYTWVISLLRKLKTGRREGYVMVDLNYAIIKDLCRDIRLGTSGYVFIIDRSGDIVYHPLQQLVYGGLKSEDIAGILRLRGGYLADKVDGRELLYTAADSSQTGWTVVAVSYMDELFAGFKDAEYSFLMLALFCIFVAIVVASLISMRISKPIESLRRSMQQVEGGVFDIEISVNCSNEVSQLAYDCNIALKTVRELILQNRKDGELKRVLELRALQAQINPHFLYNTLDSIIWMIELDERAQAIDVTSALAKFFRLGINRGSEIIAVRTELEYLGTYLSIQKARYKSKLDYEFAFPPEMLELKLLKLLVQPVVENAIYHGIKNKDGPGLVQVRGLLSDGAMLISVSDNGVGMNPERLEAVRQELSHPEAAELELVEERPGGSGGVGLRNVQERIRLYAGEGFGLSFESELGQGTVAWIRLPALSEAQP
ncbi:MAG TPA: sensor histidine kinase [Rectinemataceae bacterium]|nr:sensor histidine kinase [Rectinemataceae bacterium]